MPGCALRNPAYGMLGSAFGLTGYRRLAVSPQANPSTYNRRKEAWQSG